MGCEEDGGRSGRSRFVRIRSGPGGIRLWSEQDTSDAKGVFGSSTWISLILPAFRGVIGDHVEMITYEYLFLISTPAAGTSACHFFLGEVCIALRSPGLVSILQARKFNNILTFSQSTLSTDQICTHVQVCLQAACCCTHRELGLC